MMYNRPTTGLDALGRNPQADMIGKITQQDLNMFQQIRDSIAPIMGMMGRR